MSIGTKVSYLVVFFSFIGMTLLGIFISIFGYNQTKSWSLDKIKSISQVTNDPVSAAILFDDKETAKEIIQSILEFPNFIAVAFIDINGNIYASTASYEDIELPKLKPDNPFLEHEGNIFHQRELIIDKRVVGSIC